MASGRILPAGVPKMGFCDLLIEVDAASPPATKRHSLSSVSWCFEIQQRLDQNLRRESGSNRG